MTDEELYLMAKELGAPYHLLKETARLKRLPVVRPASSTALRLSRRWPPRCRPRLAPQVNFAAGGIATPADAALMMQLGCDGVFVGSGIFHSGDPVKRARAIVQAVTHFNNPKLLMDVSEDLGEAMVGLTITPEMKGGLMAGRGV
jgi:pyridoxal 5'-phosphate synthase pdxS subunit